ncbi:sugar ABC transporter permease YjfF [Buchananella hordeovulneris]|uniref:ABC transporter permease subunit n=1 Tax=Buchananella hordeovulneris TaxID=52770 RepID=UPI000F5E451D|nr:sugar ABC transporter permease YjfF [Buchananella hordeovulneris]RRD51033.1 sugar ABC transporter permease YjfF [Buchananella hordeovulneris]
MKTTRNPTRTDGSWRRLLSRRYLPVLGTTLTLALMLLVGQLRYSTASRSFLSPRLFSNLLVDNSYLLVLAVGMTFVILTGGIDLSVGAVVALVGLVVATLLPGGLPLPVVLLVAVLIGAACGLAIGVMVQVFDLQPFIASLAIMFLARGLANLVSVEPISITDKSFSALAKWNIAFGSGRNVFRLNLATVCALVIIAVAFYLLHYTRFGRTVYVLGAGDDGGAGQLMGLAVGRARLLAYLISGVCAGIAGVLFAMYTKSGYTLTGIGMELDAIAPVAIGGILLTGGVGYVLGSCVGVLIYGLLQILIAREGLESWWTKVFIGVFLLAFVLLQRGVSLRKSSS